MAEPAPRERILVLFEGRRARPGAPFEEDRFLDFLLREPRGRRAVHASFEGKWRFHGFLDDVQLAFGVCFNNADRSADPPLGDFVARVEALMASRRASKASLRHQQGQPFPWSPLVVVDVFGLALASLAYHAWPPAAGALVLGLLLGNLWAGRWWWRRARYLARLADRIEAPPAP